MIGNDIVDLALAKKTSNWQRSGFLNKIFTTKEQLYIHSLDNKEITVWNLWSRKEAAYKIYNRFSGNRKLNPVEFECFDMDLEIGTVIFENHIYLTKTEINSEYIYSVAVCEKDDFDKIVTLSKKIKIEKENGVPFYADHNAIRRPVSITHHGGYERIITISIPNAISI